ncbi:hypothetical protein C8Q70DRAFT_933043 [Cubamyces menziesii]|nr:hypothetical protein C8Q70DRAFT_933043 [Cubamyces menziesii]
MYTSPGAAELPRNETCNHPFNYWDAEDVPIAPDHSRDMQRRTNRMRSLHRTCTTRERRASLAHRRNELASCYLAQDSALENTRNLRGLSDDVASRPRSTSLAERFTFDLPGAVLCAEPSRPARTNVSALGQLQTRYPVMRDTVAMAGDVAAEFGATMDTLAIEPADATPMGTRENIPHWLLRIKADETRKLGRSEGNDYMSKLPRASRQTTLCTLVRRFGNVERACHRESERAAACMLAREKSQLRIRCAAREKRVHRAGLVSRRVGTTDDVFHAVRNSRERNLESTVHATCQGLEQSRLRSPLADVGSRELSRRAASFIAVIQ